MRALKVLVPVSALIAVVSIGACSSLSYYSQSLSGQLDVLGRREPISELLTNEATSPELKAKLEAALAMRRFASDHLALPDNGSYLTYADLERPYVVWNVFAAPPLSTELEQWCFPIAGCVQYRGYFSEADALDYARRLSAKGYDTYVAGTGAYSTLGWFDDPLLNTVIRRSDARLAGLIFHELAHQQLYVKGDTVFNEGFATTVEIEGVRRWLAHTDRQAEADQYFAFRDRQRDFTALVLETRARLQAVYNSGIGEQEKLATKAKALAEMRIAYARLRETWDGYEGYDRWFRDELNNAKLGAVSAYHDYVPVFRALLARRGGDLGSFYAAVEAIADAPPQERLARLRREAGLL